MNAHMSGPLSFNPEAYPDKPAYNYYQVPHAADPIPTAHVQGAGYPQSAQEAQARALLHEKGANLMHVYANPRDVAYQTRIGNLQADCWWCMMISIVFICILTLLMLVAGATSTAD